jgi:hypothetical protein
LIERLAVCCGQNNGIGAAFVSLAKETAGFPALSIMAERRRCCRSPWHQAFD